jgi:ubiquinone/menaquinone biosynthesis C-methylase UbiE
VHKHEHGHKHDGYHMDFSQVEHFARHFDGPERDAWQMPAHVLELMNVQPGQTVADIGTGTGYFIGPLAKVVGSKGRVLALDVEPNMVRYVEERSRKEKWTNVEARVVAGDDPKLAAESVDGILIVNTWHHIDQRPTYARKLARALRPAGAVFVVDFTKESDVGPPAEHRLSADEVIQELREAGLNPSVMTEKLPKHYVVRATL